LRDITPLKIEQYQRHRVIAVSPAMTKREVALLKHVFNMAAQWGPHQGMNPCAWSDSCRNTISGSERQARRSVKLLACCAPHVREMAILGPNTGLRSGDIHRLTWKEVDLPERRLKIMVRKTAKPLICS